MSHTDSDVVAKHAKQTNMNRGMELSMLYMIAMGINNEEIVTKRDGNIVTDTYSLNDTWMDFLTNHGLKKTKNK